MSQLRLTRQNRDPSNETKITLQKVIQKNIMKPNFKLTRY